VRGIVRFERNRPCLCRFQLYISWIYLSSSLHSSAVLFSYWCIQNHTSSLRLYRAGLESKQG